MPKKNDADLLTIKRHRQIDRLCEKLNRDQPSGGRQHFTCYRCGQSFWASRTGEWRRKYATDFFTGSRLVRCPACLAVLAYPMASWQLWLYLAGVILGLLLWAFKMVSWAPTDGLRLVFVALTAFILVRDLFLRVRAATGNPKPKSSH